MPKLGMLEDLNTTVSNEPIHKESAMRKTFDVQGYKFLTGAGTTIYDGEEYAYKLPSGDGWGPWMKHPTPGTRDGQDCGPGGYHIMLDLNATYAPSHWHVWEARGRVVLGRSGEKARVVYIQVRRIPILQFHEMLRSGQGAPKNLSGANLSGADLSGASLSGANLSWADLSGANLSGANLSGANLFGANLSGANLSGASLFGANLSWASLYRASLSGASLFGALADMGTRWPAAFDPGTHGISL